MSQQEDAARRMTDLNLRLTAGRTLLGAHIDMFIGLSLVGNHRDAEGERLKMHAQLDMLLDTASQMTRNIRAGAGLQ